MIKVRNFFPVILLLFCFSQALHAAPLHIRLIDYYPVYYKTEDGWKGMDIDIIKAVLDEAGFEYKVFEYPFNRALLLMETGELHIMPNLTKNSQRSKFMYWLGPVRYTAIGLVVQKRNVDLPIKTYNDLITIAHKEKKKFGYVQGASYSDFFDQHLEKDIQLKNIMDFVPHDKLNKAKLQAGRIIGFFEDDFEAQCRMTDNRAENVDYQNLALHSYRIEGSDGGAYIGLSKKLSPETVSRIKAAYTKIIKNGIFSRIHNRWVGQPPPPDRDFNE